jgi:hypothetical protein
MSRDSWFGSIAERKTGKRPRGQRANGDVVGGRFWVNEDSYARPVARGENLTQALRAEPGGNYYFRTSPRGLDRTKAEGRALVELSKPVEVQLD